MAPAAACFYGRMLWSAYARVRMLTEVLITRPTVTARTLISMRTHLPKSILRALQSSWMVVTLCPSWPRQDQDKVDPLTLNCPWLHSHSMTFFG